MKLRRRIYYSAAQRSEIRDRWQAGEPMSSIAGLGPKYRRRTQAAACLRAGGGMGGMDFYQPTVQRLVQSRKDRQRCRADHMEHKISQALKSGASAGLWSWS